MNNYACALLAVSLLGLATPAFAQEVLYPAPTAPYYAPGAPVTTYYGPSVPVTTYYAPAPVTYYYAPASAPVVVSAYPYYARPYYVPRRAYRRGAWVW